MDLFSARGATQLGAAVEAFGATEQGAQMLAKARAVLNGEAKV